MIRHGGETATFRTDLAAPNLRAYDYFAEVYFDRDPEPFQFERRGAEGDVIVLDLDGLGVLRVTPELRDAPFDRVRGAVVEVEYPGGRPSWKGILDGETTSLSWAAPVKETPKPYRYRVAWLTTDDRRIEEDWREARGERLSLDAPVELRRRAKVLAISGGGFEDVSQIIVRLEPLDGSAATELAFTGPDESHVWEPPAADPAELRYRVTTTILYADGTRRTFGPEEQDWPVLVVRDLLRLEVRVVPRLLELGSKWRLALLALEYEDQEASLREKETLVIRDRHEEPTWVFRLGSADRRTYRYQLTLVPPAGGRVVTPWREADREVLVLSIPEGPGPEGG